MLGGKALVMVDGGPPKTVAVGDNYKGIRIRLHPQQQRW